MGVVFVDFLKSVIVGASILIPGISGATMVIALGIYDRLLRAIAYLKKSTPQNILFLMTFIAGTLIGAGAFSRLVLHVFRIYELYMIYFFVGCVIGSIPMLFRRGGVKTIKIADAIWVLLGYLCVVWVAMLPVGLCITYENYLLRFIMLVAAGMIVGIAFILPGISTSYILLLLGIYDSVLYAIQNVEIAFLLPVGFGCIIGIFVISWILLNAFERHKKQTYMLMIGFMLGSVFEIIPKLPIAYECIICAFTFVLGFIIVKLVLRYSEN